MVCFIKTGRSRIKAFGRRLAGFTLVELLVVMTIIAILLTVAVPRYMGSVDSAKEAALKSSLARMREAIDQYHADKGLYPPTLDALIESGYLRAMPIDPFTESTQSWVAQPAPADTQPDRGVYDVRSGAAGQSRQGQDYGKW